MEGRSSVNAGTKIDGSWMERSWMACKGNVQFVQRIQLPMRRKLTFKPSLAAPFFPSFPSSPSTAPRRAYVIRSLAGARMSVGNCCVCRSQIASAQVFHAFGVSNSGARGIASACVTMRGSEHVDARGVGKV